MFTRNCVREKGMQSESVMCAAPGEPDRVRIIENDVQNERRTLFSVCYVVTKSSLSSAHIYRRDSGMVRQRHNISVK